MPKVTVAQSNITAGELSPTLLGRTDIERYRNAAKEIENFLVLTAGGAQRRPGTYFVGEVKDSSASTRIIDFTYSTSQTYIIEMGNLYMRFYTNNGRVVEDDKTITGATKADPCVITSAAHNYSDGDWIVISDVAGMTELNGKTFIVANSAANTFSLQDVDGSDIDSSDYTAYVSGGTANKIYEIVTPYTTAQLFDVQYAQEADVAYFTHPSHQVRKLERLTASSFSLSEVSFLGGPFLDDNTTAVTITPSADAGAGITLTASDDLFNANHVGALWKIKDGHVEIKTYVNATSVTADVLADQDGSAGNLNTGPAATDDWAEGAWSDDEGYPSCVSFYEQRLVFAGTTNSPQSIWGSYIRVFNDFFPGTGDSDSYKYTIATEQVNAIRWMSSSNNALQIGTFGGTFAASSGSSNEPITPTNINVQRSTTYGAANIIPKRIGSFIYYVQRNLKILRELGYSFDYDVDQAKDMNLLSNHILGEDGVVDMAYQQSPNNVLWLVRSDGELATLTRQIDQEVVGWTRQILGGTFQTGQAKAESVAVIPGLTGDDQVWLIVKRTINSATRRYVEYVMPQNFDDQDDAFFVDSGLSLDDPKTITSISLDNWQTTRMLYADFDGSHGATSFTADTGQVATFGGNARLDGSIYKFGTTSLTLDGDTDYVSFPDSSDWDFGVGDFTIDGWFRFSSLDSVQVLFSHFQNSSNYMQCYYHNADTKIYFAAGSGGTTIADYYTTGSSGLEVDTWYHIAIVRNGATVSLYINGVNQSFTERVAIGNLTGVTAAFIVGNQTTTGTIGVKGWIDSFRVLKGVAYWTSNFTAPTSAYLPTTIQVTSTAHEFSDGDQVKISDITGTIELNGGFYLVANAAANTFELTDLDGNYIVSTDYSTYVTGGEVRKMVTSITGLDHLEGETVQILADGAVFPNETVSSGAITLDYKAAKVHVGLGSTAQITYLPIIDGSATGGAEGKMKKIYQSIIRFYETLGVQYGREDNLEQLVFRSTNDEHDQAPPLFTGLKRVHFPAGYDREGETKIVQTQPLPVTILSISVYVNVHDV